MGAGRLKLDLLPAGAVVGGLQLQDAVIAGALDGGHGVTAYWYGKNKAASLFGTPPPFGWRANEFLGWMRYGGGQELYDELVQKVLGLNLVGFLTGPMPTQPLGWFKKPVEKAEDLKGLKYRTVGLSADVYNELGAAVTIMAGGDIVPAMDRGLLEAAEFNNPSSDRLLGFPDVSKVYMLQSYHQSAESFEIIFNKSKYDGLPPELQAILKYAAESSSADMSWKAMDRYSKDLEGMRKDQGVKSYKTPELRPGGPARRLGQGSGEAVGRSLLQEGDRVPEGVGKASGRFRPRIRGFAVHLLQSLFRSLIRAGGRVGDTGPPTISQPSGGPGTAAAARHFPSIAVRAGVRADAKVPTVRRSGQHLGREDLRLVHRHPDLRDQLRGFFPLRVRPAHHLGLRCQLHPLRHAIHHGRRLCAQPQQPRPRRFPLSEMAAASPGRARSGSVLPVFLAGRARLHLFRLRLRQDVVDVQRALVVQPRRAAGLSVQGTDPDRRLPAAAAGDRRGHPLHHLLEDGSVAAAAA